MKRIIFFLPLLALIILCCTVSVSGDKNKKAPAGSSVVVLELFTSQGCSSCPPADKLLGSYVNKENIFPLSFHVDYWNHLGWKDPFSDHSYSERQETYASLFGLNGVYTPQLVINGQRELVGSEEELITIAVNKYSEEKSFLTITIDSTVIDYRKVTVKYTINGAAENTLVNAAVVQNKVITPVGTGENGGTVLTNYNVVRAFESLKNSGNPGSISLELPKGDKKDFSVIVFVQDKTSYKILSAAKTSL